jgi:hypothetical protein
MGGLRIMEKKGSNLTLFFPGSEKSSGWLRIGDLSRVAMRELAKNTRILRHGEVRWPRGIHPVACGFHSPRF